MISKINKIIIKSYNNPKSKYSKRLQQKFNFWGGFFLLGCFLFVFYFYITYENLKPDNFITQRFTIVSCEVISSFKNRKDYLIKPYEFCGSFLIKKESSHVFREEIFFEEVYSGDTLICKIKKEDINLFENCENVQIYELIKDNKVFFNLDKINEFESNDMNTAGLLLWIFFLLASIISFYNYYIIDQYEKQPK